MKYKSSKTHTNFEPIIVRLSDVELNNQKDILNARRMLDFAYMRGLCHGIVLCEQEVPTQKELSLLRNHVTNMREQSLSTGEFIFLPMDVLREQLKKSRQRKSKK